MYSTFPEVTGEIFVSMSRCMKLSSKFSLVTWHKVLKAQACGLKEGKKSEEKVNVKHMVGKS